VCLVPDAERAIALQRSQWNDALSIGEDRGHKLPGFDLGNSPSAVAALKALPERAILRTSNGVRVVSALVNCREIVLLAFVNAWATARWLHQQAAARVAIICSDPEGDDDLASALYLEALLLRGLDAPGQGFSERIAASAAASRFRQGHGSFPIEDLQLSLVEDRDAPPLVASFDDELALWIARSPDEGARLGSTANSNK